MIPAKGLKTAPSRNRDAAMKQFFLIGSDDRFLELLPRGIDARQIALHETDFAPAELLDEVVAVLRSHPDARDLEIAYTLGDELPARVRADRERLRQLLLNLGMNAKPSM